MRKTDLRNMLETARNKRTVLDLLRQHIGLPIVAYSLSQLIGCEKQTWSVHYFYHFRVLLYLS